MPEHVPSPFRVLFTDLLSDRAVDTLPVKGLKFDDYIGKTGSVSGTLPVPDQAMAARVRQAVRPGRTGLWVLRDGAVWWGGIVWTATPQTDERGFVSVDLQGATFDSYLDHRLIFDGYTATGLDQLVIARQLVDQAQTQAGGNLGIALDDTLTSGVLRDKKIPADETQHVREALDELAKLDNGFEWRIRTAHNEHGERTKTLQLGYPVIRTGDRQVMLSFPGNVLSYSWPEDATQVANAWQSRGATVNKNQAADSTPLLSRRLEATEELAAGWPRLDGSSDYNTVRDARTLNDHARADLDRARRPVTIPTLTVRVDDEFPADVIGRTVRLRVLDTWFHDGLDAMFRVVGCQVSAGERGSGESAELYLEAT